MQQILTEKHTNAHTHTTHTHTHTQLTHITHMYVHGCLYNISQNHMSEIFLDQQYPCMKIENQTIFAL